MMSLLAEDLLLLALDDEKGTVPMDVQSFLDLGLAGAMIADLAALERLHLEKNFWGEKLSVVDASPAGHVLLDQAMAAMVAKPDKSVGWWVHRLPRALGGLRTRLLDELVTKGTLQRREQRILLLFHREVYPEHNKLVERDIRQRMDAVVLHGRAPEPHMLWLLQMAAACRIVDTIYPFRQRGEVKKRIKALVKAHGGNDATAAVDQVIKSQQAAVMMAIMAASVAATSVACSGSSGSC